jgi:hypothetical protein
VKIIWDVSVLEGERGTFFSDATTNPIKVEVSRTGGKPELGLPGLAIDYLRINRNVTV